MQAELKAEGHEAVQAELKAEGHEVSISKLCRWLGVSRRSYYYQPKTRTVVVDEEKASKVKAIIERFPTYGYRRIAFLLGWNRKVVQRICQLKGWQVRKRPKGHRPRVQTLPSVALLPDQDNVSYPVKWTVKVEDLALSNTSTGVIPPRLS